MRGSASHCGDTEAHGDLQFRVRQNAQLGEQKPPLNTVGLHDSAGRQGPLMALPASVSDRALPAAGPSFERPRRPSDGAKWGMLDAY